MHAGRAAWGGGVWWTPLGASFFCLQSCPHDAQAFSNQTAQGCPLQTLSSFSPRVAGGAQGRAYPPLPASSGSSKFWFPALGQLVSLRYD